MLPKLYDEITQGEDYTSRYIGTLTHCRKCEVHEVRNGAYSELKKVNQNLSTLNENMEQVKESIERVGDNTEAIASSAEMIAYNTEVTAFYAS